MITRKLFILSFSLVLLSCNQNSENDTNIILIDANKKYPELELKLSDLADILYIPLENNEIIFGYPSAGHMLFVYDNKIFIGDQISSDPKLLVYDLNGKHIGTFGSYGRGPGEYLSIRSFVVDSLTNEVTLYDREQKKFIVYGLDGKFRFEKSLWQINHEQEAMTEMEIINDDYLLVFNHYSQLIAERYNQQVLSLGKTMFIIDKQTLTEIPFLSFEYANPRSTSKVVVMNNLTPSKEGIYITSERSDTIFFMNRNLEIIPKFRDVTDYANIHIARLFPAIETDRYILFSTEKEYGANTISSPNTIPRRFFAYEKKLQKLYRLNIDLPVKDEDYDRRIHAIMNNRVALDQHTLTLNYNYAALFLDPDFLFRYNDQLPEELKKITKHLKEDDNPVVMLMKFK